MLSIRHSTHSQPHSESRHILSPFRLWHFWCKHKLKHQSHKLHIHGSQWDKWWTLQGEWYKVGTHGTVCLSWVFFSNTRLAEWLCVCQEWLSTWGNPHTGHRLIQAESPFYLALLPPAVSQPGIFGFTILQGVFAQVLLTWFRVQNQTFFYL